MVGAVPLKLAPLLNVPLIVPVPVTVKVKSVDESAQMDVVPLMAPVGRVYTSIVIVELLAGTGVAQAKLLVMAT